MAPSDGLRDDLSGGAESHALACGGARRKVEVASPSTDRAPATNHSLTMLCGRARCADASLQVCCRPSGVLPILSRHARRDHRAQVVGTLFFFLREAQSRTGMAVKVPRHTPALKRFMRGVPWADGTHREAPLWGDGLDCGLTPPRARRVRGGREWSISYVNDFLA